MYKKKKSKKILFIIVSTLFLVIMITLYNVYSTIDINTYENATKQNVIRLSRKYRGGKRKQ